MKKLIFALFIAITVLISASAQIPERIKTRLDDLTAKVDKLTDASEIEKKITNFTSSAPNDSMKKNALDYIFKKSKSKTVKRIAAKLSNSKISENAKQANKSSIILLKNATIIDAISDTGKKGNILIKDEKIQDIDYTSSKPTPKDAKVYNLRGKYIIPGLIDAHVHITHGTYKKAQENVHTALKNGVTGVRDMGGDGRMLTLLKKNTQIGEEMGADIFFSTIIAGPEFFVNDRRPQSVAKGAKAGEVSWQRAITHDTDLRQVVAEAKGLGATAIKVYLNVDKDLFKKVADEAKRQGLKVWAHAAVPPTKPLDITNGGAKVMSHAGAMLQYLFVEGDLKGRHSFKNREEALAWRNKVESVKWDKNTPEVIEFFEAMKRNNSILDATLFLYYNRGEDNKKMSKKEMSNIDAFRAVKIANDMGVKICAGSDGMISRDGTINLHKEIELLTIAGLSNIDAIRAATIINAEVVGETKNIGSIERGKLANLVVLNANPLDDITNTKNIKFVVKRGKVVD